MGLYLLFPAGRLALQLRSERAAPWEMSATSPHRQISLDGILALEGVERVSPVIRVNGSLVYGEKTCSCEIKAVHSSFLDLDFKDGAIFPDRTNMPFLIMNTAAAEDLNADIPGEILLDGQKCALCGIFDDGSELPTAYMSYDTASHFYPQTGQLELLIALTGKGYGDAVAGDLQRQGLSASFDENIQLRWELQSQQVWLFLLASGGFLTCAGLLIAANRRREIETQHGRIDSLLLAGMMPHEVKQILPLRILFAILLCLAAAVAVPWILRPLR